MSLRLRYTGKREIRMGGPTICTAHLSGPWVPFDRLDDASDVHLRCDGALYLVEWKTAGNTPGFVVHELDPERRLLRTSERLPGIPRGLRLEGESLVAVAWDPARGEGALAVRFG